MKKKSLVIILTVLIFSMCSCSDKTVSNESSYSESVISEENEKRIINDGKYYFTSGNGYIEITEGKYFQLVDFDDEFINELVQTYAKMGSVQSLYFDEEFRKKNNIENIDPEEIRKKALGSTQLRSEIVDNKAEFKINIVPDMIYFCNSDCELTYFLDEVGLWFPVIYLYNETPNKLMNEQFGYEFVLKE